MPLLMLYHDLIWSGNVQGTRTCDLIKCMVVMCNSLQFGCFEAIAI